MAAWSRSAWPARSAACEARAQSLREEREVGQADERRHVRRQALDGRFEAGAGVVGAVQLDERLGGAGEHDGGGARIVGRRVGERAGGIGFLRQIVPAARAGVDVAQRGAAAAILEEREAIVVVDGGRQISAADSSRRGAGARRRRRARSRCTATAKAGSVAPSPICS